jgi:diaminohydroxyphosphoribosylaminopyrimidine deaminase/5-amino-6-(5-phosphoribosylamino)uracil reductase
LRARRNGRIVHRPVRVVVDSRLRVPATARLYREEADTTWVLTARGSSAPARRKLTGAGVRLLDVGRAGRYLDLERALHVLARNGLTEILVEGGGALGAALLRGGLVDEVHWFASPMFLGADARPALGVLGIATLRDAWGLRDVTLRALGDDIHIQGSVEKSAPRGRGGKQRR